MQLCYAFSFICPYDNVSMSFLKLQYCNTLFTSLHIARLEDVVFNVQHISLTLEEIALFPKT